MKARKQVRLPKGWTLKDVEDVRLHYENQTDDEAVAEYEGALRSGTEVAVMVPRKLLPEVRKFIAARLGKQKKKPHAARQVA